VRLLRVPRIVVAEAAETETVTVMTVADPRDQKELKNYNKRLRQLFLPGQRRHLESVTNRELGVVRRASAFLLQLLEQVVSMQLSIEIRTRRANVTFLRRLLVVLFPTVLLMVQGRTLKKILSLDVLDPDLEHAHLHVVVVEEVEEPVLPLSQLQA